MAKILQTKLIKYTSIEINLIKIKCLIQLKEYTTAIDIAKKANTTKKDLIEKSKKILIKNNRSQDLQAKSDAKKAGYKKITEHLIEKEVNKEKMHQHQLNVNIFVGLGALLGGLAVVCPPAALFFGAFSAVFFLIAGYFKGREVLRGVQQDKLIRSVLLLQSEKLARTDPDVRAALDQLKNEQNSLSGLKDRPKGMSRSVWNELKKSTEQELKTAEKALKDLVIDQVVRDKLGLEPNERVSDFCSQRQRDQIFLVCCREEVASRRGSLSQDSQDSQASLSPSSTPRVPASPGSSALAFALPIQGFNESAHSLSTSHPR